MFGNRTLAGLRRQVARTLKDRCDIYVEAEGVNEYGHPTHVLLPAYVNIPCRLISTGRNFNNMGEVVGEQEVLTESYRLITPYDVPLGVDMVVDVDGIRFDVTNVWLRQTDATDQQAVIKRRVTYGENV